MPTLNHSLEPDIMQSCTSFLHTFFAHPKTKEDHCVYIPLKTNLKKTIYKTLSVYPIEEQDISYHKQSSKVWRQVKYVPQAFVYFCRLNHSLNDSIMLHTEHQAAKNDSV